MANKKTYVIEINGIQESTKSIDALSERLKTLQNTINSLQKGKVTIPVELSQDIGKLTTQIQNINKKIGASTKKITDISGEEEYIKLLKQREKALEAVNKEMGDTGKNAKEYKEETKAMVAELTKARNESEGYANTLNGLKKELKDLNSTKGDLDLNSEAYREVSERIYLVTTRLKELEAEQGNFQRNVGNYYNSIMDAADDMKSFSDNCVVAEDGVKKLTNAFNKLDGKNLNVESLRQFGVSIKDIKNRISELENVVRTADIGSKEWKDANQELVKLKTVLGQVEASMKDTGNNGETAMRKIRISVNGVDREFNGVSRAVQGLQKELQSMAANGQQDTAEFKRLVEVTKQFRKEMLWTSDSINEMTKYETKVQKFVGVFQGFNAAMQVGTGVSALFGNDSDIGEMMNKMMALMSIMQGLQTLEEQIKTGKGLGEYFKESADVAKEASDLTLASTTQMARGVKEGSAQMIEASSGMAQSVSGISSSIGSLSQKSQEFATYLTELSTGVAQAREEFARLQGEGKKLGLSFNTASEGLEQCDVAIAKLNKELQKLRVQSGVDDFLAQGMYEGITSAEELREKLIQLGHTGEELELIFAELQEELMLDGNPSDFSFLGINEEEVAKTKARIEELKLQLQEFEAYKQELIAKSKNAEQLGLSLGGSPDELSQLGKAIDDIEKPLDNVSKKSEEASAGIGKVGTSAKKAATSTNVFSRGLKFLGTSLKAAGKAVLDLLKALPELLAVMAAFEAIMWIFEKVQKWVTGNADLISSIDSVTNSIENATKAVEDYNRAIDDNPNLTGFDKAEQKLARIKEEALSAAKEIQNLNKAIATDTQEHWWEFWKGDAPLQQPIQDMKQFQKEYDLLKTAVEAGIDINKAQGNTSNNPLNPVFWQELWNTAGDARDEYGEMQKKVIGDILYDINRINFDKPSKEADAFFKKLDNATYSAAIANIENLFPEEEWAKTLSARLNQVRNMYSQMNDLAAQMGSERAAIERQIEDNLNAAIKDGTKRNIAQLETSRKRELEAAQTNAKSSAEAAELAGRLRASINAKYETQIAEARNRNAKSSAKSVKSTADDLANALKKIRDNNLAAEEESLQKRIQLLKNQRDDELKEAKKMAINAETMRKLIASIHRKYDAMEKKERQAHLDFLDNLTKQYVRKQIALQEELAKNNNSTLSQNIEIDYTTKQNTSEGNFNFDAIYKDRLIAEKEYQDERLRLELDYLNKKKEAEKENENINFSSSIESEKQRYEDALKQLKDYLKQGQLSQSEYNKYIQDEQKNHNQAVQNITKNHNDKLLQMEKNYQNDVKETISSSLKETISLYEDYANEIEMTLSNIGQDRNFLGAVNISSAVKAFNTAKKEIKNALNGIAKEYQHLDESLKSGKMTYADYKDAKKQLKKVEQTLKSEGKRIKGQLGNIIQECANDWASLVGEWVGQVESMLQTLNDTQLQLIDNELAMVEHQLEVVEKAYEAAEARAEAHKNKMDTIEDELAEARGSRREFLLDGLAAQQQAYQEDLAAQEKAELQKQRLEEKQKKLEKKRKEQEKKAAIQTAIINTFTAVSNALSVQPWFLGLALSAVALALGMANVAAIKNTPVYEDGGVIQGKRHSQGGVKVLGGQAEVEGGEFITNRKSTKANLGLLEFINSKKRAVTAEDLASYFSGNVPKMNVNKTARKFAEGGTLPTLDTDEIRKVVQVNSVKEENATYVVQVTDIINAQDNLKKIQVLSGLNNK